jgi:rhodanese-related sulfurtransferase
MVRNMEFDKEISSLLDFSIPVISVQDARHKKDVLFLDAREKPEYEISHIPGAVHIGYDHWDKIVLDGIPKDREIILYCSVGYRSEKIGNKLKALGFSRVRNLYGSIFEWVNKGLPLEDSLGGPSQRVHTYNKNWSKWVTNTMVEKIW